MRVPNYFGCHAWNVFACSGKRRLVWGGGGAQSMQPALYYAEKRLAEDEDVDEATKARRQQTYDLLKGARVLA